MCGDMLANNFLIYGGNVHSFVEFSKVVFWDGDIDLTVA